MTQPNRHQWCFNCEVIGVATILGIGNAGFGMPDQTRIDLAYLLAAIPWGLDADLVDPAHSA